MGLLIFAILALCTRTAIGRNNTSSGGNATSGGGSGNSSSVISVQPCSDENQEYFGVRSQQYAIGNDDIVQYKLKLRNIRIPLGERLMITTIDPDSNNISLIAELGSHAIAPVSIKVNGVRFIFSSSSASVLASFRILHYCLGVCRTASCDLTTGNPIKVGLYSWQCKCKSGYKNPVKDNRSCVDIDECSEKNTSSCKANVGSCINLPGSWKCDCKAGYTNPIGGNKQICEDVDECAFGSIAACGTVSANCTNLPGTHRCDCGDRYTNPPDKANTCVEILCGTTFTAEEGIIDYPQFGGNYPLNDDCVIEVISTPGKILELNFTRFDVRYNPTCDWDYLELFDDPATGSPRLGIFCGRKAPGDGQLTVRSNYLRFHFKSFTIPTLLGFAVRWTSVDDYCQGKNTSTCNIATGRCVNGKRPGDWRCDCNAGYQNPAGDDQRCEENVCGSFSTEEGVLDYPDDGGEYGPNESCMWRFSTTQGKRLRLYFTRFNLEYPVPCNFDYLEILDGLTVESPSLGKFSGNDAPGDKRFMTNTNSLRLAFKSDSTEHSKGFRMVWNTVEPDGLCGDFNAEQGELEFPKGGREYENSEFCNWHIATTPGKNLKLNFTRFDMEFFDWGSVLVCSDRLEIYDPHNSTSSLTYCKDGPGPNATFSNSIRIEFESNHYNQFTGFKMNWTTV